MQVRRTVADAVLGAVLAVFGAAVTAGYSAETDPDRQLGAFGVSLIVISGATLAVRRRWPLAVLAVVTVSTATYLLLGYTYGPILISFFVAVYTAARHLPMRTSLPAALAAMVVMLLHLMTNSAALPGLTGLVPGSAWVVVPYAVGTTVRQTRIAAERARAELVREHVADERLRVAQEVHDVVGHGLAAIKMQADVALHVLDKRPEQASEALIAISRTSTEALEELRSTLALVRQIDDERAPTPGLSRLGDLTRRMTDAGVRVDLTTTGTSVPLPATVDLTAYRLVQEALTNVLRHSSGKVAWLRLDWQPDSVDISVTSHGAGAPSGDGLGLTGMRTRVESVGGSFSAGPIADDRFEVRATLPVGGTR
jgi:signal transduction histidine kinase